MIVPTIQFGEVLRLTPEQAMSYEILSVNAFGMGESRLEEFDDSIFYVAEKGMWKGIGSNDYVITRVAKAPPPGIRRRMAKVMFDTLCIREEDYASSDRADLKGYLFSVKQDGENYLVKTIQGRGRPQLNTEYPEVPTEGKTKEFDSWSERELQLEPTNLLPGTTRFSHVGEWHSTRPDLAGFKFRSQREVIGSSGYKYIVTTLFDPRNHPDAFEKPSAFLSSSSSDRSGSSSSLSSSITTTTTFVSTTLDTKNRD